MTAPEDAVNTADFVHRLTRQHPGITEAWLIGSRVNDRARDDSDWDYLVMADAPTLDALRRDRSLYVPSIDLLIVYDGNKFASPWMKKEGSLTGWKWRRLGDRSAVYEATKSCPDNADEFDFLTDKAVRVWPR